MKLIDPRECPCAVCTVKFCVNPGLCAKFADWLTEPVEAEPVKHTQLGEYYIEEFYGQWADCKECGTVNFLDSNYCSGCGRKITQGGTHG